MTQEERLSKIGKFLSAFRACKNLDIACLKADIKKETIRRWLKKYKDFALDFATIEYTEFAKVENVLLEKIFDEKDLKAVMYYLDRKGAKFGYGKARECEQEEGGNNKEEGIILKLAYENKEN